MTQVFQAQVVSLIVEGIFDQFPELRVVLIESGFTWLPALMWRIDKEWRGLETIRRGSNVHPLSICENISGLPYNLSDAPPTPKQLLQIIGQLESDEMLLFSTDYPHWQFNTPNEALPSELPGALARKILHRERKGILPTVGGFHFSKSSWR